MSKSDKRYEKALATGDLSFLRSHNLLHGIDIEIQFLFNLILSSFGKELKKGKALDVCCGIGTITRYLDKIGFDTVGFDLNQDAIKIAKKIDPDGNYFASDATKVCGKILSSKYKLIFIREAHPFTRIHDDKFQIKLISKYLELLETGGVLVIAQATGKKILEPSVSFSAVKSYFTDKNYQLSGPYMLFLYKHLRLKRAPLWLIKSLSLLSQIVAFIFNLRLIAYFVVYKVK